MASGRRLDPLPASPDNGYHDQQAHFMTDAGAAGAAGAAGTAGAAGALRRNFYGRRHGKTLRDSQRDWLSRDLAALSPGKVSRDENPDRTPLDMAARFGGRPVWLDIGFGGGEHVVHQAQRHPDVEIVGCEPFVNGVAMLLGKIRSAGVRNISVYPGDARDLFDVLPEACVARAFLLYPDPWPKQRHHERRFMTAQHLGPLARVMQPGAAFRVATDSADYARQTRLEVPRHGFAQVPDGPGQGGVAWDDWAATRYELKALRAGRAPIYLTFVRY
jgi:tRNA (guanine-N7-)-methyltransferase